MGKRTHKYILLYNGIKIKTFKNNILHGMYIEYYFNGSRRCKGKCLRQNGWKVDILVSQWN